VGSSRNLNVDLGVIWASIPVESSAVFFAGLSQGSSVGPSVVGFFADPSVGASADDTIGFSENTSVDSSVDSPVGFLQLSPWTFG
jgi:hypothetical protein